jgi:putative restriction endonuclease
VQTLKNGQDHKRLAMATLDQWLQKIARLKVDKARGDPAPHKPLLLLSVLEIAERDGIRSELLPLTPELSFIFATYWQVVASRRSQAPRIRLPFFHLKSDGLWTPVAIDGTPTRDKEAVAYAAIPADVRSILNDPFQRERWRRVLVQTYFPPQERIALYTMLGMPVPTNDEVRSIERTIEVTESQRIGREARFRLRIVAAYNYTCALTGYRLTTLNVGSIVDAAHIHQFAASQNNNPENGLALCKNAHWSFDQGLWTVSDNYRVIVAVSKFTESSPDGRTLSSYHGQKLRLPQDSLLWPSLLHCAWHRQNRFIGIE